MVGVAIYDILKNDSAVAAIVGTKIYPIQVKRGDSAPYITYQEISNVPSPTKQTASLLDQIRVQISSFATKHQDCFSLAKKVRTALDKASGIYATSTFVTKIKQLDFDGEIDLGIDSANLFERAQDYIIWCEEYEGGIETMEIESDFTII